ncbi:MAG: tRNA (adenosine(37)-N6)-threonylcarbamoyltransferase complex transferase subunit TsaD [Firmicutes bacterium]|nr:tRNA (adenosine(37)-N6)-threonylcarbamoyltransferase complex transferase subunit TsaD [Bacillota bacterium]
MQASQAGGEPVRILAIESSCDETAAAVVENGVRVLSNIIDSQIPIHRRFGGVVPEVASRRHLQAIWPVTQQALEESGLTVEQLSAVAVTAGPGLVGSLLVGVSFAKALAFAWGKPLIGVHHWQGHIAALQLERQMPREYLALVVSGSHSGLLKINAQGLFPLGMSHDDAAGEAFDKIARALYLPYPGGPEIDKAAKNGRADAVAFPRAWLEGTDDFSFSGLKSAVLNYLNQRRMKGEDFSPAEINDLAASAQEAICDVLSAKAVAAAQREKLPLIALAGGVAANSRLRALLQQRATAAGIETVWPSPIYCTDNAAMIGAAAYGEYRLGHFASLSLNADPRKPFPLQAAAKTAASVKA